MSLKFNMIEMSDLNGKGKIRYPKMFLTGTVGTNEIAQEISARCTLNVADVKAALSALSEICSEKMSNGYSVKLEGLGIFTASLGINKDKEREKEEGTHRNARSVEIRGINFRAEKNWVKTTNSLCKMERTSKKFARSTPTGTKEERLQKAHQFIKEHQRMTVTDYSLITGLTKSTATRELRESAHDSSCGLTGTGRGPLRHYIWKES